MHIQWFPGHMTKALRMMAEEVKAVDSVIYILDARAPMSCINSAFDAIIAGKPRLYILNKVDLVPPAECEKWVRYFAQRGYACLPVVSTGKKASKEIVKKLLEINADSIKRYAEKGVKKTVRAMVIGVPNCGKSTFINSLLPEKRTVTGNRPGVTRGKQAVAIDKYIDLIDTPGVLYPDFSDQQKALNLAMIGSIRDQITDIFGLACEVVRFLREKAPKNLANRYDIDWNQDAPDIINAIGAKRGFVMRGGEIDAEKAALAVVTDFRKQSFGKIILEECDDE